MFTTDLGPDNYDVVEIKVEPDDDDVTNNIETVRETKPGKKQHIDRKSSHAGIVFSFESRFK